MQTIVVTGATRGLGRLVATELRRRGARVLITARDPARAEHLGFPPEDIFVGDLARLDDVRRIGRELSERHDRIDVLINNAGLHAFAPRTTVDGLPEMVAVNYVAPWLLTRALLPALHRSPAARVVTVASEASRRHGTLRLPDDLSETVPFTARGSAVHYGRSKLFDIMFTMELARRLAGSTVTANCLDPGFNVTGLGRELRFSGVLEQLLTILRVGDPARGSGLIVALATDPAFAGRSGEYWTVRGPRRISPASPGDDPVRQLELWQHTERITNSTHDATR